MCVFSYAILKQRNNIIGNDTWSKKKNITSKLKKSIDFKVSVEISHGISLSDPENAISTKCITPTSFLVLSRNSTIATTYSLP